MDALEETCWAFIVQPGGLKEAESMKPVMVKLVELRIKNDRTP